MAITVALVDDQPLVKAGLRMLLEAEEDIEVVGEGSDGYDAVRLAKEVAPQVLLLDLRMPRMDGVEATRRITQGRDGAEELTRVLALTTFDDEETVHNALRAGASGFMLKHASPTEIASAVRRVAAGDAWLDPAIAGRVIDQLRSSLPSACDLTELLTQREQEVLTLMSHGLTNPDIRRRLVLSEATVKTHVSRILLKTGCHDRAGAVARAYRSGFISPTSELD